MWQIQIDVGFQSVYAPVRVCPVEKQLVPTNKRSCISAGHEFVTEQVNRIA